MRILISALCAIFGVLLVTATPTPARNAHLLGAKECTWGPGYWCSNITNAKGCHAVRHCIQTVWEKQTVPEDNDSICQICLDMVKQARDQLESNETQEDLKAVFEGSCKLIPLKPVQKECMKLADNFIPELVEALASQMNPQVVCSVAGLCNNAAIDKMLEEYALLTTTTTEEPKISPSTTGVPAVKKELTCSGCNNVATIISNKFHSSNRDVVLENMLHLCGKLSSLSDACSNIVITYFNEIYDQLKTSVNSESICHISGVCSSQYHQHPEIIEIRPMSDLGFIPVKEDIPCELCEQLVRHLRDLLIANTTEEEFKQVLEGLCNQSKGFKTECLSIVDQYYDSIYQVLVNNLDENGACFIMGLCPKGDGVGKENIDDHPIMPLLPMLPPQKIQVTIKELPKKQLLGENEPKLTNQEINSMQLPIDKLMGAPDPKVLVEGGQLCTFCEYFLHFVQEALSTPSNEEKIKHIVSSTCSKLPTSVRAECDNFIDEYGDAVIALLIQEIDPSQICPMLRICPQNVEDMEVFAPKTIDVSINSKSVDSDKPTCPLCLFAVQQAQEMIKSDKSKDNIRRALDNLCSHLPKKLEAECIDFIDTYSKELVEMLVTDFTPQEICVYIKLCTDKKPDLSEFNIKVDSSEDILTNEIPDNTVNGIVMTNAEKEYNFSPQCSICITIINEVEKRVINKKSKEQIKYALDSVCHVISKYEHKCEEYIKAHGDQIADLIMKEIGAKQVCRIIGYCIWSEADDLDIDEALTIDVIAIPANHGTLPPLSKMTGIDDIMPMEKTVIDDTPCVLCEFVMVKLEKELHDKKTQDEIKTAVQNICSKMPKTVAANCKKFIDVYADLVISVIDSVPPKEVCQKINLCPRISTEVTDEIVECGVCHGTVSGLYSYIKEESSDLEHPYLVEQGCENLPARYYKKCSELINYYGESIINLVRFGVEQSEICAKIGKCFEEEKSSWAYMSLNAANNARRTIRSTDKLVGANKCTWGPSYWCSHEDNAAECKTTSYCVDKVWGKTKSEN